MHPVTDSLVNKVYFSRTDIRSIVCTKYPRERLTQSIFVYPATPCKEPQDACTRHGTDSYRKSWTTPASEIAITARNAGDAPLQSAHHANIVQDYSFASVLCQARNRADSIKSTRR
jgi:hypothetical protein